MLMNCNGVTFYVSFFKIVNTLTKYTYNFVRVVVRIDMVVEVGVFEVLFVAQITVEVGLQIGKTRFFRLFLLFVLLQIIFSKYGMPNAFL